MKKFFLICLIVLCSLPLPSQQKKSPVYKNPYRFSGLPLILYSAFDAQLVEVFTLMQEANAGKPLAQHDLAIRYLLGRGLPPDTPKAIYWLMRASEKNLPLAHYNLGILHLHGIGVPWNPFDAYKHFRKAAEEDFPEALFAMGVLCSQNFVVQRNWQKTFAYIKRAAELGYDDAKEALAELRKRGIDSTETPAKQHTISSKTAQTPAAGSLIFIDFKNTDTTTIVPDTLLRREALNEITPQLKRTLPLQADSTTSLIQQAAYVGVPEALCYVGRLYETGAIMNKNLMQAALYYLRAIRLESIRAPSLLWHLIHRNDFYEELDKQTKEQNPDALTVWAGITALQFNSLLNEQQAFSILTKAAEARHPVAMSELALCYYTGRWTPPQRESALYWFKEASEAGLIEARLRIALMSLSGETSVFSPDSAFNLVKSTAEKGSLFALNILGLCYEKGYVVAASKGEAFRIYNQTLSRGSETAYRALMRMHNELRPADPEFNVSD